MSDMNYEIGIQIKESLSSLTKFKKAAESFDKGRESALKRQIVLLQKMKNLQAQVGKRVTNSGAKMATPPNKASGTVLAQQLKQEEVAYTKTQQALTKRLEREEQERTRIAVGQVKARLKAEQEARRVSSARIKQSVGGLTAPSGAEGMRDYYRKLEKESLRDENAKTKEINKQAMAEQSRLSSLEKTRATIMNSALMTEKEANAAQRTAQENIRSRIAKAKTSEEMRKIVAQERASLRLAKKKSFLVSRMEASSKEFAGNMVSAFAVAAGGVFITQTGQNFESAANTMLSVSDNAQQAGENMQFVKDEAFRLGLGLTEATKGFAKLAAARGNITLGDTKELFLGVSELSTVLGLTTEESGRALLAIQQMASKGKISAEELRLQLGEVLPQGIQLMADATKAAGLTVNGTVAEMSDLMEKGQLLSEDVLPFFAKNMRDAAKANNALEKALDGNRVAMNRLITATQNAADTIFKSGWSEGLTELFNSLAEMIKENETLFTEFGKTMGKIFKGLAWLVENVLDPIFSALGSILKGVNDAMETFGDWVAAALIPLLKFTPILGRVVSHFGGLRAVMGGVAKVAARMFLPFYLGLGVLEEIAEFFSPTGKKTLLRFNVNDISNPFEAWAKTLDDILSKIAAITGSNGTSRQIDSTGNVTTPYMMRQMATPTNNSQYPANITVKSELHVSGDKMGEAVSRSPAIRESVNRQINNSFQYNHN